MSKTHEPASDFCAAARRSSGRVHLPVAPRALARIRFSAEKPLPRALTPEQALNWLDYLIEQGQTIKAVNVGGPGDPMATPELTMEVLAMLRAKLPGVSLCLTTLGLGLTALADRLAALDLAHLAMLVDAVDPLVAAKVYAWIRPGVRTIPLAQAADQLINEQAAAITALKARGLPVIVKTTVYPGVNVEHVELIAATAARLGATELRLFPFSAVDDGSPRPLGQLDPARLEALTQAAAAHLPTMFIDPRACDKALTYDFGQPEAAGHALPRPSESRPYLAVCSSNGFDVDLHLGQAEQYLIYGPKNGPVALLEARPAPAPGGGEARWRQTAQILGDCFAVLAAAAGEAPKRALAEAGLSVLCQEGNIEGMVEALHGGRKKGRGK